MLFSDVTLFLTTILIGTTYSSFYAITLTSSISIFLFRFSLKVFLIVDFISLLRVVNIGASALVTDAATAIFGEAGVSVATRVIIVAILLLTEITPKSIAVHNPTEVARSVASGMTFCNTISGRKSCDIFIDGNAQNSWSKRKE
ncbi:hypothetical protein J1N35_008997 [Gossypium stocksii]|uniref:CNNM transmembrane domain-containing protein n=1 Tax=Gossypium stocksii TaxID=47602 RepID=A0A9D4AGN6_9ROSI|nr:hypothetical protein J1N35_008997 [Gossypium stocksii]